MPYHCPLVWFFNLNFTKIVVRNERQKLYRKKFFFGYQLHVFFCFHLTAPEPPERGRGRERRKKANEKKLWWSETGTQLKITKKQSASPNPSSVAVDPYVHLSCLHSTVHGNFLSNHNK